MMCRVVGSFHFDFFVVFYFCVSTTNFDMAVLPGFRYVVLPQTISDSSMFSILAGVVLVMEGAAIPFWMYLVSKETNVDSQNTFVLELECQTNAGFVLRNVICTYKLPCIL